MAKKKAAKKASRKTSKKLPTARRAIKRSKQKKLAGTVEVVKLPVVDVTSDVKDTVVEVKPPTHKPVTTQTMSTEEAERLHKEFTAELKKEPEKKGFFARLFRR